MLPVFTKGKLSFDESSVVVTLQQAWVSKS